MKELLFLALEFVAGIVLGILFFYGLWLTVRRAFESKMPALWFVGGFLLRTAITLAGFYFVSMGNWQYLIACLAGFVIGRYLVNHFAKPHLENRILVKKEVVYEP